MNLFSQISRLSRDLFSFTHAEGGLLDLTQKKNTAMPGNWFRAFSISGKPAGLAFECPRCRLTYTYDAPASVFHCGKNEERPPANKHAALPERRIVTPGTQMTVGNRSLYQVFENDSETGYEKSDCPFV